MSGRTSRAIKGTATSILQYVVYIALQPILAPLVLRMAGQEALGAYSIVMQIVGYGILLDLGFSVALGRYLAQTFGENESSLSFCEVFSIGRVFLLVTNSALALTIFAVAFWINRLMVASDSTILQARIALYLLAVWSLVRTPLALYNHGLMATQNMAAANIAATLGNTVRLLLSLGLVYAGMGLLGLVSGSILSELMTNLLQRYLFQRKFPSYHFRWRVRNKKLFTEMFLFGIKYFGVNLAAVLSLGSDSLVVGKLYGASMVSVFYTTKIPAFLLIQFIYRISDNAGPAANELFAAADFGALRTAYLRILRYSMLLAFPLAIGIVGFNQNAVSLWVGREQFAGDVMTLALAVFVLTQVASHTNAMIALVAGKIRGWATLAIVCSAVSLVLSYWMGKYLGMQWVMVAIAIMDVPIAAFLFQRALGSLRIQRTHLWHDVGLPCVLAAIPLFIFVTTVRRADYSQTSLGLTLNIALFMTVFVVGTIGIGLNASERKSLRTQCRLRFQ